MFVGVVDEPATRDLRRRVLRPELAPADPLPGDDLAGGIHFGAVEDGIVVGTCFVYPDPCSWRADGADAWRLRQMATAPERRGFGLGAAVLDAVVTHLSTRGVRLLWCHARESAAGFYVRQGFVTDGERFEEHHLPHLRMARELPATPASSE